jgi:hypothetical protein
MVEMILGAVIVFFLILGVGWLMHKAGWLK